MKRKFLQVFLLALATSIVPSFGMAGLVDVDFGSVTGPVKPVNGVGQPPLRGFEGIDLFHYLKEAGIPYSRLHDVGGAFGKNLFVDIPNLFRDFEADENDPKNYDFTFTDMLLKALVEHGVEPYFRLGVTIENASVRKSYRIFPPQDYAKWARICEHVIRHYTEGWADGYRMKITHWEIWNEPDGYEDPEVNHMWKGTFLEYCRFYETASKHLKAKFPHLKIGGYASCGFYDITKTRHHVQNTGRYSYLAKCFVDFVDYVKEHECPWDFFSFHCYDDPANAVKQNRYVRDYLDANGFEKTELSLNEWMPFTWTERNGSARKDALIAGMLAVMQNGPIDDAEVYDAKCGTGEYSPLFSAETGRPRRTYWTYYAFNELRMLKNAVKVSCDLPDVYVVAADDGFGMGGLFVVNTGTATVPVTFGLQGREVVSCRVNDETREFEEADLPDMLTANSVWRILVKSPAASAQARPDLVAKAESGEFGYVRASWYGYDADDSTAALQAALDSKARKVIVDRMPQGAWPTRPLACGSNKEILFENGAEICAKRGEFRAQTATLLTLTGAEHVAIRGRGRLRMRRDDYVKPPYSKAEWRFGVALYGVKDVRIEDITVSETGGDGLYVGALRGGKGGPSQDVFVRNCVFEKNLRQGVSVISVDGLEMDRCVMRETKGALPEAGIDFEPNGPDEVLKRIVLRDCTIADNNDAGIEFYLMCLRGQSEPIDVRFENCRVTGSRCSVSYSMANVGTSVPWYDGIVTFDNCLFKNSRERAIQVTRRKYSTGEAVFRKCRIDNACTAAPTNADVVVSVQGMGGTVADGIRFEDLVIRQRTDRPWLTVKGEETRLGLPTTLSGTVRIGKPDGTVVTEVFDAARQARDFPYVKTRPLPPCVPFDAAGAVVSDAHPGEMTDCSTVSLRGKAVSGYVFYADRPRDVRLRCRQFKAGKHPEMKAPLTISELDAPTPLKTVPMPGFDGAEIVFSAPHAGFYAVGFNSGASAFRIEAADVPIALDVRRDAIRVISPVGRLWAAVPAETEASLFACGGKSGEAVGVGVRGGDGAQLFREPALFGMSRMAMPAERADGLREVEFFRPEKGAPGDGSVGLTGVPGFLFLSSDRYWK